MTSVDQQTAQRAAAFWLDSARNEPIPSLKEQYTDRAIKNLMIASHGRA